MKKHQERSILLTFLIFSMFSNSVFSQPWEFAKEKDGIRVYTRKEPNSTLKSFKGETILTTSIDKVFFVLGDATNFDWWDKDISLIKVLSFEPGKNIKYYLVYDVPWPLADRDLAVNSDIAINPTTGDRTITATPMLNVIPEKKDVVRIKKYWQRWTVQSLENGKVRIIMEGFVDPAGNVPAWLYNMTITETPLKVIQSLRDMVLTGKTTKR